MLQQHQRAFAVSTRGREFHEITGQVEGVVDESAVIVHPRDALVVFDSAHPRPGEQKVSMGTGV